jgi:CHAT domain-containing protein
MVAAVPLSATETLRVLHVQVSPIDMEPLDLKSSQRAIAKAFGDKAEIVSLKGARSSQLRQALSESNYHFLHYDGHAQFDENLETGVLFLHDKNNRAKILTAEVLADYLSGTTVSLVVLSGCETGVDGTRRRNAGLAQHLMHSSSIPVLVAMQFSVADEAAIAFNQGFYKALVQGLPVEVAMVNGRLAMLEVSDSADWLAPLLFMRVEDGRLLNVEP